MARIIAHQAVDETWEPVTDAEPLGLVPRPHGLMLELPVAKRGRPQAPAASVNGFDVVAGTHALEPGDLVRVGDTTVVIAASTLQAVRGGRCVFSGQPLNGVAVVCPCSATVSEKVARQLGACPRCGAELHVADPQPPVGEML
jgi:hypothetical protein